MRYMLFHYTWTHRESMTSGDGNLYGEIDSFPSNEALKKTAASMGSVPKGATIVIASWSEFSSEKDYQDFMGQNRGLKITSCVDPSMWYANMIGDVVPFVRDEDDCYISKEPSGHTNIVHKQDAEIVYLGDA
mgnify:CR=1 FL=1